MTLRYPANKQTDRQTRVKTVPVPKSGGDKMRYAVTISMLDLLTVGQKFTRPACPAAARAADNAHRPPLMCCRARCPRQTDGRTDGHDTVLIALTKYAVHLIM